MTFGRAFIMKHFQTLLIFLSLLLVLLSPVYAQSHSSQKPELIRDTDIAEGKDASEAPPKAKEQDPVESKKNINIGNFYLKQKNYAAAIERYLEATEYQIDSVRACEALARAYEKNGDITKAISTYKTFIEKNPNSPNAAKFRIKIADLEKKAN
jgi:tetratricopeptide (TPR) repeat protein